MTLPTTTLADQVAGDFQRHTQHHRGGIIRDDGLYRHLRFRRFAPHRDGQPPSWSSSHWFDVVTWPGALAVNGDSGSFLFACTDDMFDLFRGRAVNPGYWAEKIRAADRHGGVMAYSAERFREEVMDAARQAEDEHPGITAAVERDIFGDDSRWNTEHEDGAREALAGFEFDTWTFTCPCGEEDANGLGQEQADDRRRAHLAHCGVARPVVTRVEGFRFRDSWEWDLSDFSYPFLWFCHAIVWAIGEYDAAKAAAAEPVPAGAG